MLVLQYVFDEIKLGFFDWFYKHACNQRARMHAATYDRVVDLFFDELCAWKLVSFFNSKVKVYRFNNTLHLVLSLFNSAQIVSFIFQQDKSKRILAS